MANEKRLIDANALMEAAYDSDEKQGNDVWHTGDIECLVMAQPTVDAVEVVRCKDCKYMKMTPDNWLWCNAWCGINGMGDEGFCNYGERKDNERKAD